MYNRLIELFVITGSVFITSGNFVDKYNTVKNYFVLICLLLIVILFALGKKQIKSDSFFTQKMMLWGINLVCFTQACYGLLQYVRWLPSNYSSFAIIGSFDNPAGFAAVLSISFSIGLQLLVKTRKIEQYLAATGLIVITIAIFLSESRAGILAILTATAVFFLLRPGILSKFRTIKYAKLLMGLTFVFILTGAFILYHKKKDSANGRILIWQVSWEMIKDKPVLGHGYGAFQAEYMNYQAEYFKNKPDSEFELLADNVKHPFNEFVKLAVEFGITGLVVVLLIILFVLWKLIKSKDQNSPLVLSGLLSFLVFACFSYPLQYIAVWLLLAFYLSVLLPSKEIRFKNTPFVLIAKSLIIIACIFSLYNIINHVKLEIRWKTIALNSLKGNTEKMLPEYEKLYSTSLNRNPFFLYNYGAELNFAGRFDKSIDVLTECQQQFNDYDLQMLLADNYDKKGEMEMAVQIYQHATNMVPCRFLPLYKLFNIYKLAGAETKAKKIALEIVSKKIKVPSHTVSSIRAKAEEYISGTAQ